MSTATRRTVMIGDLGEQGRSASATPLAKLAWRNLFRQRRRTTILVIVVAYATLAIIFFWGFTDGFLNSTINGQARFLNAPALITTPTYFADPDPENALPDLNFLEESTSIRLVRTAAPRLDFPGLIRSPYATQGVQARGVDPALENAVSSIPENVGEGRMLERVGETVIGKGLAESIDIRLGERLALDASSQAGPQATGLIVVGLVDSGIELVDETTVLIHIEDARGLTGVETATGVALDIPFGREEAAARALQNRLPEGVQAYPIKELLGPLQSGLASERAQMLPLSLIFSLFAAITVTSTVVVSVLERTREFGIIIALGLDQNRLSWLVTLEAIFATALGFGAGLVLGYGLTLFMGTVNILGPLFANIYGDFLSGFALSDEIYTVSNPEYLIYTGFTIALAALFAVLTPARRVRRLNPSEAIRSN